MGSRGKKDKIFYSNKFGFTLCQQNGQRTYGGPPPNWGSRPPPSRDSEVFIGRLPRMCFEDELIPLFLTAGELYEFRLMLDFSGTNRGYGYAHYATPAGAQRAIEKLNKYEIRPGHQIGVLKSKNNCRLLFGNIGSALNVDGFNEFIRTTTDQVLNVLMFKNFQQLKQTDFRISSEVEEAFLGRMPRNNGSNQFAIVEYENHKAAAVARRVLIPKYGHILAIDWAVPPRDRKRFCPGSDSQIAGIERPILNSQRDSNLFMMSKSTSKIRPVPVLVVQSSPLDNLPFMPKTFKTVVKFFKYQLSVGLYKSVDQTEIPLFICREIERKIVDRITNLENCSQAVQLIFNYFSWYNEKKRLIINVEVQKLLQEVKVYADSFIFFVNKRLKHGPSLNSMEDNYYMHILPLQLNVLFRIILRSDVEHQAKLSTGITKGLKWLMEIMEKGNKSIKEYIEEIIDLIKNEDGSSLDKASTLAKSLFLNSITSQQLPQNFGPFIDLPEAKNLSWKVDENSAFKMENFNPFDEDWNSISSHLVSFLHKAHLDFEFNLQNLNSGAGHTIPLPLSKIGNINDDVNRNSSSYPPVPLLLVQPSIMNRIPFMPAMFNNVIVYLKYLMKICLNICTWQMGIPWAASNEIERKIIDRICNIENCAEGAQLILNYFCWWIEKKSSTVHFEALKILQEIKMYSDSFVNFVWSKSVSVYVPNESVEEYFCKILPLRLNILYQMTLILNSEHPQKCLIGISKGLDWIDELIQKSDVKGKQFLEEMTRFILEHDLPAFERAKNLGKDLCSDLLNFTAQTFIPCNNNTDGRFLERNSSLSSSNTETACGLSISSCDNASEDTFDYDT